MALYSYTLPNVVTPAGVLKTTLFATISGLIVPSRNLIASIGDSTERIEPSAGVIQLGTIRLTLVDDHSNYTEGFWMKILNAGEMQLRFYLDEGLGDTFFFWGYAVAEDAEFSELLLSGSTRRRVLNVTLRSMMSKLETIDLPTLLTWCFNNYETTGGYGIRVRKILGKMLELACGTDDVDVVNSILVPSTQDIEYYASGSWRGFEDIYLLTGYYDIFYRPYPYFDSSNDLYWGNAFRSGLDLFGALCRNFGFLPYYYFGSSTGALDETPANNKHRISLLQRGRSTTNLSFGGRETVSAITNDPRLKAQSVRVTMRAIELESRIYPPYFGTPEDVQFSVEASVFVSGVEVWMRLWYGSTLQGPTKIRVYDYVDDEYVEYDVSIGGNDSLLALARYNFQRYTSGARVVTRRYSSIKAIESGQESHRFIRPVRVTSISDGSSSRTYYANEVRKDVLKNRLYIQWIEL